MRILVFGDSIAYGSWDSEGGWPDRLKRELHSRYVDSDGAVKFQLLNLGIGGNTSTNILARLKAETEARYSENWQDVFVFAFGTNDSRLSNGVRNTELDTFRSNAQQIIDFARTYSDRVLFVGLPPIKDDKLDFKVHVFENAAIEQYEAELRKVVQAAGLPFVEVREAFNANRAALFSVDGLHPNDAGHKLILDLVQPELDKLITP